MLCLFDNVNIININIRSFDVPVILPTGLGVGEVMSFVYDRKKGVEVPIMPTMYSMSLAGGLTDDRALLCSVSQSSMNFPSVISGSDTEHTPKFRIIQTHSNVFTSLPMLQSIKRHERRHSSCGLWNTLASVKLEQEITNWRGTGSVCIFERFVWRAKTFSAWPFRGSVCSCPRANTFVVFCN